MGDMREDYDAYRAHSRGKKEKRYEQALIALAVENIHYVKKNDGVHLIINRENHTIDYWPTTGKWKVRNGRSGYGVEKLIDFIHKVDDGEF